MAKKKATEVTQSQIDKLRDELLEVRNGMSNIQEELYSAGKHYSVCTALKYLIGIVDRNDELLLKVYEEKET